MPQNASSGLEFMLAYPSIVLLHRRVAADTGRMGAGVYFAQSAAYSLDYCRVRERQEDEQCRQGLQAPRKPRPQGEGKYAMLVSRVIAGVSSVAAGDKCRRPPRGFHSVSMNEKGSTVAVFDNNQYDPTQLPRAS